MAISVLCKYKLLFMSSIYHDSRKKAAAAAVGAVGVTAAAAGPAAPIAVPATAVGVFLAAWAILTYRKS